MTSLETYQEVLQSHHDSHDAPTMDDIRDMHRMVLPLDLHFPPPMTGIEGVCVLIVTRGATWEYAIITSLGDIYNGGSGGAIWLFLAVMFGMGSVILSLAEMASMAPASAGQYHWVSVFAPPKYQRLASYGVGWFTAIGWQASVAGNAVIIAQQIQAVVAFQHPSWSIPDAHGFDWLIVLLMTAAAIVSTLVNMYGIRFLPGLEGCMLLLHLLGFFAILFPLWIIGDLEPAHELFFTFQDNAGWGNIGLACLVGILGPTVTLEETRNAQKALPIAMILTSMVNFLIGFIMTITILIVAGNYSTVIADQTEQPYLAVIYAATGSKAATVTFGIVLIFMFFFCEINTITTTSRQLFAFARDGGLPGSRWLSRVNSSGLPMHALLVTFVVTFLLSFIAAGSSIAFNNIISISLVGLLLSYGSTILTILTRRWRPEPLPDAYLRYSRPVGTLINSFALCFVTLAFVFIFFPTEPNPPLDAMNWSVVVSFGIICFAALYYVFYAKHTYYGPAARIAKRNEEEGFEAIGLEDHRKL